MLELVLYEKNPSLAASIESFVSRVFEIHMEYFASDLLEFGLKPFEINTALNKAMVAAKCAGLTVHHHFHPQYSDFEGTLIRDCKLSRLGYGLTLLNADVSKSLVAKWQVQVVNDFFTVTPR